MFKSNNRSINNLNVNMPGKHDSENKDPPFLSMLTNNANKRLSFIDKGKSWARQLLKNSSKGLNASQNSFESCDSGIDANSFIRGSLNPKTNQNKMPQSSSCSFITTPYLSSSSSNSSTYNTPTTESILTTSKSTSFTSDMSNSSFDQVYSSSSNSSSSSGYLISPIDESGYLVPIVTLNSRQPSFNEKRKPVIGNPKVRNKNRFSNFIPSCSPLTRSFSTRSAYTNQTKQNLSYSQYNPSNRATICEQINVPESTNCIKCNCKINNLRETTSECENSTEKNSNDTKQNAQELNKYNQDYNIFDSHTCASCISSTSDFNSLINNNSCKPPIVPAPTPPVDKPPQLPQSHPPRCINYLTNKTSIPSNPPPPLPLHPPPTRQQSIDSNFNNNLYLVTKTSESSKTQHQYIQDAIKIIPLLLCSNNNNLAKSVETLTKSIENLESFSNLFKEQLNTEEKELKSPELQKNIVKRRKSGNEIVYIDSADLESSFGGASSSSVSLSSSAGSLNKSTLSNSNINMNHFISMLRQNQSQCSNQRIKTVNNDYNKLSYHQQETENSASQQHDYHVIDEIINETAKRQNFQQQDQQRQRRLTPNNSLASFDFIDPNNTRLIKLDTSNGSYEKSWEKNSTVILLDRLNEKLASSLIAIANEQKKERIYERQLECQTDGTAKNCNMREKISDPQQQNCKRISFQLQRASLQKSLSQTLNSFSSGSGHHSFSSSHQSPTSFLQPLSNSNTIDSAASASLSKESNSNSEDVEHLLTMSSTNNSHEDDLSVFTKSYTNSSNSTYQYTSEIGKMDSLAESWYQPDLPRERVYECLSDQEIGSFIIRLSNTCKNCYALSIRVPYFANQNGIAHYLITKNSRGFKLKGVEKEFKTLKSLVTHYSVMQEILPVTLNSLGNSTAKNSNDSGNQHQQNFLEYSDQNNNIACIY